MVIFSPPDPYVNLFVCLFVCLCAILLKNTLFLNIVDLFKILILKVPSHHFDLTAVTGRKSPGPTDTGEGIPQDVATREVKIIESHFLSYLPPHPFFPFVLL